MADWHLAAHDETHAYRFCPRCGGELERRLLKATEPERLVCLRCGFVFYLDPKIAVGTIIRMDDERWCSCGAPSILDTANGCFLAATSIAANRSRPRRSVKLARNAASTSGWTGW